MPEWIQWFVDSRNYMPHGHCYLWQTDTLWLNVGGDALIGVSYVAIPLILYLFVRERRHEIPLAVIPLLFAAFILLCGATHWFSIYTVWNPEYRMEGALKVVTGLVSVTTAAALLWVMPVAMQLQTPTQLQREVELRTQQLAETNRRLSEEVSRREIVEQERGLLLESERVARADAERANRAKEEFLATLSHELRTPLGSIASWAEILASEPDRPDQVARAAAVIERGVRAQVQLVSELLDMSSLDAGKLRLDVRPIHLEGVIEAALEVVEAAAEAKGIRISKVLEPLDQPILGDPARLQQVLWNLLSNAIKFTPRGGKVQVSLARVNSHVELIVSDTGCGIAPDTLPHVFERFRQGDHSASRQAGGLGIGLALVKELVEMHGGRVSARSDGPGRGAAFAIELPLSSVRIDDGARVHPRAELRDSEWQDLPGLAGLDVLVVDDQRDAAEGLARILENAGASVRVATSADDGLAALRARRPDLLISDIGMPDRDGYELIRAVRAEDEALPAAALTAFARSEDRTRALLAGYDAHLAKPIAVRELLVTVATLAGRRSLHRPRSDG